MKAPFRNMFLKVAVVAFAFSLQTIAVGDEPPKGFSHFTDEALKQLSLETESLTLRGARGYGNDEVTDKGIEHLVHYKKLRVLNAGALGLTDLSLESIGKLTELEELSLDSNQITGVGLHHLTGLKKLRKLNLHFNPLQANWPEIVSQIGSLQDLRAIVYERPLDDGTLEQVSKLTQLQYLELNEAARDVTDAGIAALTKLTQLTSLSLNDAKITSQGLKKLQVLEQLQVLRLRSLREVEPGSLTWLPNLIHLRELGIVSTPLNADDMHAINQMKRLESLLVWSVSWGSEPLEIENLDGLKSLRAIRTNEIVKPSALLDLSKISTVEAIGDDLTELSDDELQELAKLPKLQSLYLDSPDITESSLPSLSIMRSLRFLCVSDRVHLTPQQLARLGRESLNHCKIVARKGGTVYFEPPLQE